MVYPKISIITASLNGAAYIEDCIRSIVEQGYPALEYIIVDGGSTDGTMEIVQKYADKITLVLTEKDAGPGQAINNGFKYATGEIMGWVNTDDRLHPKSLFAIAEIFNTLPEVDWAMGFPTWFSSQGICINEIYYNLGRFYYSPKYINDNLHLKFARWSKRRFAMGDFSAIQQESVFWRRALWEKSGAHIMENVIAFDLELWTRFFEHAQLYTANVLVGGFRIHGNQISFNQRNRYREEAQRFIDAFREKLFSQRIKFGIENMLARLMKPFYYYNIPFLRQVYPNLLNLPPYLIYDLHQQKFALVTDRHEKKY
ncbi:MAG TPA: glycosyltransferase family 2 protein [Chitinophagales bacterium]|nr:glycosyltransferase family 2 protein [Chitinophagales bacterium]